MYQDKTLTCRDCGSQFTFTASEQEFYAERALPTSRADAPNAAQRERQPTAVVRDAAQTDRCMKLYVHPAAAPHRSPSSQAVTVRFTAETATATREAVTKRSTV